MYLMKLGISQCTKCHFVRLYASQLLMTRPGDEIPIVHRVIESHTTQVLFPIEGSSRLYQKHDPTVIDKRGQ